MDGLIRGLADIAFGHEGNKDDRNNNNEDENQSNSPSSRDERSRSTWAQVVSGDPEKDEASNQYQSSRIPNQWNNAQNVHKERLKEEEEGQNEGWQNSGQRHSGRPQHHYKEEEKENDDEWKTVEKRPQRQPHKVPNDSWHGYKRPSSEQDYSNDVEYGASVEPSNNELSDLSQACSKLWELDSNRLVPGKDYEIDCGEGKKSYQKEDMAQQSLFRWLNEDIFRRPTYSRFCSLLDNYNPNAGVKEVVTSEERQEEEAFIEEISRTAPIKYLYKYLTSKRVVSENYQSFKKLMTDLWFGLYGRCGTSSSSSAFEHVFVGEIKQQGEDCVTGFHNWLQFYLEEAKGKVDYQGYIFPRRRGQSPDSETQLLTLQFEWSGVLKSLSSTLVGVSPEFEVALYTLCFFMGGEDNHIELGPYSVNIKCYRLGNDKIGSAFPIAE